MRQKYKPLHLKQHLTSLLLTPPAAEAVSYPLRMLKMLLMRLKIQHQLMATTVMQLLFPVEAAEKYTP